MKKIIPYNIIFIATVFAGCSKYLDKEPDNRTNVSTPEQIAQLLTNAYPKNNYILFCEAMSDNAEDKGGGGSSYDFINRINRQSYRFEVVEESPYSQDGPDAYWNGCYKAIAQANQALKIISEMPDPGLLTAQRGEALLARAYAHFMLVTLYSKTYDPATAASNPGIPYVTQPETKVFNNYERNTVAYVYEMIEKDIVEGYPLIDDKIYGTAPKFHFNKKAAAAFLTRFYLFKRDYPNAIVYANQAITNPGADNLRPWNTTLTNLQYNDLETEYTKSSMTGNLLLQEANSFWGMEYPGIRYGLGETVASALLFRRNVSGGVYTYDLYGAGPQNFNIPKFYTNFVTETINANSGQPYNTIPLLTAEEAILNRAEAYIWMQNYTPAIADINAFLSKNIEDYVAATHNVSTGKVNAYYGLSTRNSMLNAVLDLKRAFFIHEGMRWLDIIRLNIPVLHNTNEGEELFLAPDDNRRVLQLPSFTKQAGLEPNPR